MVLSLFELYNHRSNTVNGTTISLTNLKGGTAKTTSTINLGAGLRDRGHKVLLLDLDPQANLSQALKLYNGNQETVYDVFKGGMKGDDHSLTEVIKTSHGMDVVPASLDLAQAELELVSIFGRERILDRMLKLLKEQYDCILIDCPPSVAMLTVNALVASDYILMPVQAEFLGLNGVVSFHKTLQNLRKNLNLKVELLGIFLTRFDHRKIMNKQVREALGQEYPGKLFTTKIRTNIALAKAQEAGKDIFSYAPNSHGALDYKALTQELLKMIH